MEKKSVGNFPENFSLNEAGFCMVRIGNQAADTLDFSLEIRGKPAKTVAFNWTRRKTSHFSSLRN